MIYTILTFVLGAAIGAFVVLFVWRCADNRVKPIGTLVIDNSDPEDGPLPFLELPVGSNFYAITQAERVVLDVEVRDYISQE